MENSVNRNKVAHIHEVVYNLVHWFDDKIFRLYPTWEDCVRNGIFPTSQLESFFGPNTGGGGGKANYARCVQTGIGRKVIAKMLEGTAGDEDIRKALENLPMSARRRRYEAEQAEKERRFHRFRRHPWGVRQRWKLYKNRTF